MKSTGPNPNSIWNMVPENADEADWLEMAQHILTCHDWSCSCHHTHDLAFLERYQGKATLIPVAYPYPEHHCGVCAKTECSAREPGYPVGDPDFPEGCPGSSPCRDYVPGCETCIWSPKDLDSSGNPCGACPASTHPRWEPKDDGTIDGYPADYTEDQWAADNGVFKDRPTLDEIVADDEAAQYRAFEAEKEPPDLEDGYPTGTVGDLDRYPNDPLLASQGVH